MNAIPEETAKITLTTPAEAPPRCHKKAPRSRTRAARGAVRPEVGPQGHLGQKTPPSPPRGEVQRTDRQ